MLGIVYIYSHKCVYIRCHSFRVQSIVVSSIFLMAVLAGLIMDCVFCDIVSGTIPAKKLYESNDILAFLDAFPVARGHCLVIPKMHFQKVQDMPCDVNAKLFDIVHKLTAKVDSLDGATLIAIHNGKASGQEVPHVHVHLIPRREGDGAGAVHTMFKNSMSESTDFDGDTHTTKLQNLLCLDY